MHGTNDCGYPDNSIGLFGMGAFAYAPSSASAGSGQSYWPGDTSADAGALNYLGYLSDAAYAAHVGTTGSQSGDMSAQQGAWDPAFRTAVTAFQKVAGITADSWIGPNTRAKLATFVQLKNASGGDNPIAPPVGPYTPPGVIIPTVPTVPTQPIPTTPGTPNSPAQPVSTQTGDNTLLYVGGAVGVAALGLGLWYFLK